MADLIILYGPSWAPSTTQKIRTITEVLWPLFLFATLVSIRQYETLETYSECHYPARALPSAGVYPWLKGFMCNFQNPCFNTEVPSEIPGQVNSKFNQTDDSAKLRNAFNNLLTLLNTDETFFNNLPDAINNKTLLDQLLQSGNSPGDIESKLFSFTNRTSQNEQDFQTLSESMKSILQILPYLQETKGQSILFALLGVNTSSPSSYQEFCDHPQVKNGYEDNATRVIDILLGAMKELSRGLNPRDPWFCYELFNKLEHPRSEGKEGTGIKPQYIRFLWLMVKPFIRGKIPYSPNTPLVKEIIENANATFSTLGTIHELGVKWQKSIGPTLFDMLENGKQINALRATLHYTDFLQEAPFPNQLSTDQVEKIIQFLSNEDNPYDDTITWKDVFHQVDDAIAWITKLLECAELDKFIGFDDEEQMVKYALAHVHNKTLLGGVVFISPNKSDVTLPKIVKYKIRQDAETVTTTSYIESFIWTPGADSNASARGSELIKKIAVQYYRSGFVHIQDMIETAIVQTSSGKSLASFNYQLPLGSYLQEMPYPCYTRDKFLEFLPGLFPLLMTLAWVYSVCITIKNIVYEKEKRLKEVMKMMGLSNGIHWVAWFINAFLMMFCSSLLLLGFFRFGNILPFSNMFIILAWFICFALATIAQCFLISCFFTKANLAAACGGIIFFVLYIPYDVAYIFNDEMTYSQKLTACLLSSVAFGYGSSYISQYEMSGQGMQFNNWAKSYNPGDQMNFLTSMLMMLVDAVIYMILTWYVENVFPGTYGVPKSWNFFVKKSYWLGTSGNIDRTIRRINSVTEQEEGVKVEPEPDHLPLGVSMQRLKKVFNNGKVAVDDLSLNFYEGQITSFLGHNGAGKTTTMSMLTGLFTPTSGSAYIYGNNIQNEMDQIRHQLGFCPQHNVLFGDLTVLEHLQFYSGLKNAVGGNKESSREIEEMVKDVGLPHKKNEISRHLSGGMKRKLSVAVAFVGGSKCVILDEPTAGVDPYARRGIWDLLLRYRANRTILLSTHHMDEADLLGDRIAIISHGKLKCCGSSLFLKSSFGVGYYLTVVKPDGSETSDDQLIDCNPDDQPGPFKSHSDSAKHSDEGFESSSDILPLPALPSTSMASTRFTSVSKDSRSVTFQADNFNSNRVMNIVFSAIPLAKIQEENQREMTFVLPYSAQSGETFCKVFSELDACGVTYGLTDTSLEEIFLNVAEQKEEECDDSKSGCLCLPFKRSHSREVPASPDGQARRGLRRSLTSRSLTSNISDHSFTQLLRDNEESLFPEETPAQESDAFEIDDGSQGTGSYKVKGRTLVWQQFSALFVKRFHHSRRNKKGLIAQVIVPAVFVALGLLCALAVPARENLPPLELQPWMYGSTNTFQSHDISNSSLARGVSEALVNEPSIGMRCAEQYGVLNYDGSYLACDQTQNGHWQDNDAIIGHSQMASSNETLVCRCTDDDHRVLLAECPMGAGGSATPRVLLQSSDWMYNMTGRNLSDWLVKTVDKFRQARYGGVSVGETLHTSITAQDVSPVIELAKKYSDFTLTLPTGGKETVGEFAQNLARSENSKVWFDNNGFHSMPTWLNILNNAGLRSMLDAGAKPSEYGIVVVNHPLNFTQASLDKAARPQAITGTFVAIAVIFALSFVPASFVLFLIEEKITKAKHLQFVSGVNQTIYWVSTFTWDMINYLVPVKIVIIIFLCFQTNAYVSADNFPCLVCLLLLYGFSITPMMYAASFYFEVPSTAYVVLTCINMFIGINASLITFILQALSISYLDKVNDVLMVVFLMFPQYCLGRGLIEMSVRQSYADAYLAITGHPRGVDTFSYQDIGRNLVAMGIEGFVWFGLTLLLQYKFFIGSRCAKATSVARTSAVIEEDVVAERRRILEGRSDDILTISNLSKVYKKRGTNSNLLAVDRLCIGVPEGECFGLLGVNGAGKTTTFKMLTGDTSPTAGDALICKQSILGDLREVQQNTGYCPQFEALNSLLTGREHLIFYAKLRGVPPEDIGRVADWAVNKFGLKMYANKPAGTYSGGNKRKLSAAIAFIGCPPIVFLDEPTAGMDPMSRRFLWSRIVEAVRGGRCIVLTSHSMEECEALCSRLAIMVNGKLKCLGSPQHLKNKYGEGYTITIKVGGLNPDFESVKHFIASKFNNCILKESHCNMMIFQLPFKDVKLAEIFIVLENSKKSMNVEDYSVSQTTLDEVFVNFAKNQSDDIDDSEYGYQPLNDETVMDYSQVSDQLRELSGSDDIVMRSLKSTTQRYHSSTEQLIE